MIMKRLTLSIQNPCNENWDNMEPRSIGKHCLSCNKTVLDFTNFTDEQLLQFFQKPHESICGRIEQERLNQPLLLPVLPKRNRIQWLFPLTAVLSIFGIGKVKAQDFSPTVIKNKTEKVSYDENNKALKKQSKFIEIMALDNNGKPLTGEHLKAISFGYDSLIYTIDSGLISIPTSQLKGDSDSLTIYFFYYSDFEKIRVNLYSDEKYIIKFKVQKNKEVRVERAVMGAMVITKSAFSRESTRYQFRNINETLRYMIIE